MNVCVNVRERERVHPTLPLQKQRCFLTDREAVQVWHFPWSLLLRPSDAERPPPQSIMHFGGPYHVYIFYQTQLRRKFGAELMVRLGGVPRKKGGINEWPISANHKKN